MQQSKRILLIDDDHDHLLLCNITLRKRGYSVMALPGCEKMEELTQAVETFAPHLIFMDHDMRGICGQDLARFLKSHPQYCRIPIIYFSGRDDIVQLAKDAGVDDHLRKPFELQRLVAIAGRYLPQS